MDSAPSPRAHGLLLGLALHFLCHLVSAGESVTQPFAGVTWTKRAASHPRNVSQHIIQVDLATPGISFKLSPQRGPRDAVRQTTLEFLNQEHAQVAVNAHFFVPFPSPDTNVNLVGLAASMGHLYSPFEPQPVVPGLPDQSYAILPFAPALNIDPSNRVSILHWDPTHLNPPASFTNVTLWNALSGSAQIISNGVKSLPSYSAPPFGLKPTQAYHLSNSWYSIPRARTAIGVTRDEKSLVIFTVDQAGGSAGMTVAEVADLLIADFKVLHALNLDGGGSTTLILQDPATAAGRIVNTPSEGPAGRAVGSSLAIFAPPPP